jgi:hypothetical protein
MQTIKIIYYLVVIVFHWALFFTNVGNYFHGGTPTEWVLLEMLAISIAVTAIHFILKVRVVEKIFIILCAVIPVIFVVLTLISTISDFM